MTSPLARGAPLALALLLALAPQASAQPVGVTPPSAADLANPTKMGLLMADEWTTQIGRLSIQQASESQADVYVGRLYVDGQSEAAYVFDDLTPDATGTLVGTWRPGGSDARRPARLSVSHYDQNVFVAGLDGWTATAGELAGRRGFTGPRDTGAGTMLIGGNWCTEAGLLRIQLAPDRAIGAMYSDAGVLQYLMELAPSQDNAALAGHYWAASDRVRYPVRIVSARQGKGIVATLGGAEGLNGHRIVNGDLHSTQVIPPNDACASRNPNPGSEPAPPAPNSPPSAPPAPAPAPTPAPAVEFQTLRKFDVRVERVVVARDAERIDVFVTLRNATAQPLYATSGALMVRLEDSEGVGKVNGQILRPTPEGRSHFASTPVIEPGGQLRAKYSFHPDPDATPARVVITEGDKRAEFGA